MTSTRSILLSLTVYVISLLSTHGGCGRTRIRRPWNSVCFVAVTSEGSWYTEVPQKFRTAGKVCPQSSYDQAMDSRWDEHLLRWEILSMNIFWLHIELFAWENVVIISTSPISGRENVPGRLILGGNGSLLKTTTTSFSVNHELIISTRLAVQVQDWLMLNRTMSSHSKLFDSVSRTGWLATFHPSLNSVPPKPSKG